MYGKPRPCIQFLVTYVALKMFRFLMLQKNLFIIEITIAIPTPRFGRLLLLPTHEFFVFLQTHLKMEVFSVASQKIAQKYFANLYITAT